MEHNSTAVSGRTGISSRCSRPVSSASRVPSAVQRKVRDYFRRSKQLVKRMSYFGLIDSTVSSTLQHTLKSVRHPPDQIVPVTHKRQLVPGNSYVLLVGW